MIWISRLLGIPLAVASLLLTSAIVPISNAAPGPEAASGTGVGNILTGSASAHLATIDPRTGEIWLAVDGTDFQVISVDSRSLQVTNTFRVTQGQRYFPTGLAFSAGSATVWVSDMQQLASIDANTKKLLRQINPFAPGTYNTIQSLAASVDGGTVWLGAERSVFRVRTATGDVVEAVPPPDAAYQPEALALADDDTELFVLWVRCQEGRTPDGSLTCVQRSNLLIRYELPSLRTLGRYSIMPGSNHYATDLAVTADGREAFVSIANQVFAIDTETMSGQSIGQLDAVDVKQLELSPDGLSLWFGYPAGLRRIELPSGRVLGPVTDGVGEGITGNLCLSAPPGSDNIFSCRGDSLAVVQPSRIPSPPRKVRATLAGNGIRVDWDLPEQTGSLPGLSVSVTAQPGGQECTSQGTSCVLRGLRGGQEVTIRAQAANPLGSSAPVSISNSITYVDVPSAPRDIEATRRGSRVIIEWKASRDDGGSRITSYAVSVTPGQSTCTTRGKTKCVIRDLPVGETYQFAVAARNRKGPGPSALSRPVSVPIPPSPPPPPKPQQQFN